MIDSYYHLITGTQPSLWDFLLSSNLNGYCLSEWLYLGMINSSYQLITGTQPSTWDFLLLSNLIGYCLSEWHYLGMIDSSHQLTTGQPFTWNLLLHRRYTIAKLGPVFLPFRMSLPRNNWQLLSAYYRHSAFHMGFSLISSCMIDTQ